MFAAVTVSSAMAASSKQLNDNRIGNSKSELQAQIAHSQDVVEFFTVGHARWMVASRHSSCSTVPWTVTCKHARGMLGAHRWLLHRARVKYQRYTLPSHYAGWSCITNGAYPRAPHEGNGYNGSYSGPLGMTTPWLGFYPPGGDWVHAPRAAVYAIADKVASAHHYSYGFMHGQWPATYPPCARFF
jgi:hypothetical protein